jgi:hypothetical protein
MDDAILDAMQRYGGSFVVALARLFERADPQNQAILRDAFQHVWAEYREIVEQKRAPQCPICGSFTWTYHGDQQICADCLR